MTNLHTFYQDQINEHTKKLSQIKEQLFASSMIRLVVFVLAALGVYFFSNNSKIVIAIIVAAVALFLFLVSRHTDLKHKRDKLKALVKINETEIEVLRREFHDLPDGGEFKDSLHAFSQDIDLFGRGSFYQYMNRTTLKHGSETLAGLFTENSIEGIQQKQEAIKELSKIPKWRQDFSAIASLTKTETAMGTILKWLGDYQAFIPLWMKYVPWVFSIATIGLFLLYFADFFPESLLIYWLFFGMGITFIYIKKITKLGQQASKVLSTFKQYNQLLTKIENTDFTSELLQQKKQEIISGDVKASLVIKNFSKLLNSLDKNNNFLYLIFANGFFLRTLSHCYKIEAWMSEHKDSVEKWFTSIAFFDAYNSLGNFAFNHPNYSFPVLTDKKIVLKSHKAGHPLLDPEKSVLNDFQIDEDEFFIITGANMAGKSTFLRTVSLQIVMANLGLSVCAEEVSYNPIKLITSMRTTDSLTDDESYFFSELKRLKFIVDEIQKDRYFIVLDEILKGTNSSDKAKGSRKFVEKLVRSKSTGIIATHDLSLCEVADEYEQIKNHYFDAEIIDDELHFDYTFKNGICQNMNASFLLKKMGIVD